MHLLTYLQTVILSAACSSRHALILESFCCWLWYQTAWLQLLVVLLQHETHASSHCRLRNSVASTWPIPARLSTLIATWRPHVTNRRPTSSSTLWPTTALTDDQWLASASCALKRSMKCDMNGRMANASWSSRGWESNCHSVVHLITPVKILFLN